MSTVTSPRITAEHIRRVLGHSESVVVYLVGIDDFEVAETGLSKAQMLLVADGVIDVAVTFEQAKTYLAVTDGTHSKAAAIATALYNAPKGI